MKCRERTTALLGTSGVQPHVGFGSELSSLSNSNEWPKGAYALAKKRGIDLGDDISRSVETSELPSRWISNHSAHSTSTNSAGRRRVVGRFSFLFLWTTFPSHNCALYRHDLWISDCWNNIDPLRNYILPMYGKKLCNSVLLKNYQFSGVKIEYFNIYIRAVDKSQDRDF